MIVSPSQTKKLLLQRCFALAISLTLITLNIYRILCISITHDETGYRITDGYMDLMKNEFASANNHIFHSLLRKFFVETFTENLFFLRLDSLLAQALFLFVSYKLVERLFQKWWLVIPAFVLVNTACPLNFEFWGLSRGYALAIAFTITSIYYLHAYITRHHIKYLLYSLLVAILAVYSNFSCINFFVTLINVVLAYRLLFHLSQTGKSTFLKEALALILGSTLLAALIIVPLTNVLGNGELAYLGNAGFVADTVTSLIKDGILLNSRDPNTINFLIYAIVVVFWVAGIYWLAAYLRILKKGGESSESLRIGITFYLLLATPVVSVVLQFNLFGINYLIDRAAIFFVILFVLHFLYWVYHISINKAIIAASVMWVLLLPAVDNFYKSEFNTHHTRLWWYCADDMAVLKHITNDPINKGKKVKIWVDWSHLPSFKYNISKHYKDNFFPIDEHHSEVIKDTTYDYYFIASSNVPDVHPLYKRDTDVVGGGYILFRKDAVQRVEANTTE